MNRQRRFSDPANVVEAADSIPNLLRAITAQFEVMMGNPDQVKTGCEKLRGELSEPPSETDIYHLQELLPLLRKRSEKIAAVLFDFLEPLAQTTSDPWLLMEGMLLARDAELVHRALDLVLQNALPGKMPVDERALRFFAEQAGQENSPLGEAEALSKIAAIVREFPLPAEKKDADPLRALYLESADGKIRRLAARLLDLDGQPVSSEITRQLLGAEAHTFLEPYLTFTRATHLDLLYLIPTPGGASPVYQSLQKAQAVCGEGMLREIVAELGWQRVNLGLDARHYTGISVSGSLPLKLLPAESALFEHCGDTRRAFEAFVIIASGGLPAEAGESVGNTDTIARFRAYNLTHAAALADILDVAPLDAKKVHRIIERIDCITEDYVHLFSAHSEECAILPEIYGELKRKILAELDEEIDTPQLSAELTRLVQMFEDPRSLGEVRTLHGLKRYLHQKGLRLGFKLVESGRAPNRTVDTVLATPGKKPVFVKSIRYADFEPESNAKHPTLQIPYPVAIAAEGFARQLVYGQETFPRLDIFCYGNEVHYYLAFRNHPAFLRIDFAPPLQGGMIDLEYFGVSNYELSVHPNISLDAMRLFFQRLEFDFQLEGTRIHARYDKERALDLGNLCEKAEAIFRLAPYLMEIDWIIGSLNLDKEARMKVAEAWAESFALWGVLPVRQLLTADRQDILEALESTASGEREIAWPGVGAYRDRFSIPPPGDFFASIHEFLRQLGLEILPLLDEDSRRPMGQVRLERRLLMPLRQAVASGEIEETPQGFRRVSPQLFQRVHEAERFAEILASGDETVASAVALARMIAPLERTLTFRTTGSVENHQVQCARLPLRGEDIGLYVLRGRKGIIRLAFFSQGEVLFRRRKNAAEPWEFNGSCDVSEIAALLRRNNYLLTGPEISPEVIQEEVKNISRSVKSGIAHSLIGPLPGERIITGLNASPGRAVGRVLFGVENRTPADFDGAVLVAASVRPEDNTFLYHAAGIVSTGGGILSHAGLLATQFHKPALIISGRWQQEIDGSASLLYLSHEYRREERAVEGYRVQARTELHDREHRLREGDLVILNADEGTLRVLGQERDTLAIYEGFRQFGKAAQLLGQAASEPEILNLRGRRLRARHQIEKFLIRLSDPVLACYAVHELLLGEPFAGHTAARDERAALLKLILYNPQVAEIARGYLVQTGRELENRCQAFYRRAEENIPTASFVYEVVTLRLDLLHLHQKLLEAAASLQQCGLEGFAPEKYDVSKIDHLACEKLQELRRKLAEQVSSAAERGIAPQMRHLLRRLERADLLLATPEAERKSYDRYRAQLFRMDDAARRKFADHYVLSPQDGGFELFPLIGWKAANLAEIERLGGEGLAPPWFVVTERAFREALDAPLNHAASGRENLIPANATLRRAIAGILEQTDLTDGQKSAYIRDLWERITLPEKVAEVVAAAYRRMGEIVPPEGSEEAETGEPFVAIRSSSREEDAEIAARAGEFETFLFIRGEKTLLEYLKRTWSGLWTERAIHNRAILGRGSEEAGGGVIVQRIVRSRVSGVMQTVNVAKGELREIVINAGLGLGEGVVSGVVAADQITVSREGDLEKDPLRFSYITSDKREQVVFNRRAGLGTVRSATLYHQRLRPALEYVELCELVAAAVRLEAAYGYPLDIEYGIEGTRLWILQVRPVATFLAALQETLDRYPLQESRKIRIQDDKNSR